MQISRLMTLRAFNLDKDEINQRVRIHHYGYKIEAGRAFRPLLWGPLILAKDLHL